MTLWQKRAARARLLADRYASAREPLNFYAGVAEWQGETAPRLASLDNALEFIPSLLDLVARTGPPVLARAGQEIDPERWRPILEEFWHGSGAASSSARDFFPRVVLQAYAARLTAAEPCAWCRKPPQAGVLRPLGEGLSLELVCALCLRLRPFSRGRCPVCEESEKERLPVYSAADFDHLRLQACDCCLGYFCIVDLSRDPQAIAEVDELAALPLDLWAVEHGYHKLQPNLAGV